MYAELLNYSLVTNTQNNDVNTELNKLFRECKSFYISVAFINISGLHFLLESLDNCERRGVKGKILCSDYLDFTDPKSISTLFRYKNIETRMFLRSSNKTGFHTKGYIFEFENCYKILIGSSNITQSALKSNVEWNLEVVSKINNQFITDMLREFNNLMDRATIIDENFIDEYDKYFCSLKKAIKNYSKGLVIEHKDIVPNLFQEETLSRLNLLRKAGANKALVVASTGIGKTYCAAFDCKYFGANRVLYIVHNENILKDAIRSFNRVFPDDRCGLFTGNSKQKDKQYIFATIQTISNNYNGFGKKDFDYIILDEAHHANNKSYLRVLEYFEPEFILGMTATPERTDGRDIYSLFDNNLASSFRLGDALREQLLTPFHYFGISDNTVDISKISLEDTAKISEELCKDERVKFIDSKIQKYKHDGDKMKCLAFCCDKKHADFMARSFNSLGYHAISLTGDDNVDYRKQCISELQSDRSELEIICTVNIFNEGVDIPLVNLILMLRPTSSSIIFTQQLGRGLRKVEGKEFLTVLDFIANYNRAYLVAVALSGDTKKDSFRKVLSKNEMFIGTCTNISFDEISRNQILKQLDKTNFNTLQNLRIQYNDFEKKFDERVPKLMDYLTNEYPIDPIPFIRYSLNYLSFINDVKSNLKKGEYYPLNEKEIKCLNVFSKYLPIKEIGVFYVLKELINNNQCRVDDIYLKLKNIISGIDKQYIEYIFKCLNGNFYDSNESKNEGKYFLLVGELIENNQEFMDVIKNPLVKEHLLDLIDYGINRYLKEFGNCNYGLPFLKLYEDYRLRDLPILARYTKVHSSLRGQGVWHDEYGNYYYFVDLLKDANIDERINYKDKFISTKIFQYQTPNNTTQESEPGKIYTQNKRNNKLYLFVRRIKKEDNMTQPYTYVGILNKVLFYEGEKPITIKYELENEIPKSLYEDLTIKY